MLARSTQPRSSDRRWWWTAGTQPSKKRRSHHTISNGDISESHLYAELGEIVAGKKQGRIDRKEITLFKSQGLAIQDVSTALLVFKLATAKGIGKTSNCNAPAPQNKRDAPFRQKGTRQP